MSFSGVLTALAPTQPHPMPSFGAQRVSTESPKCSVSLRVPWPQLRSCDLLLKVSASCHPSSELPTNNSFNDNGILQHWHLKWLYWVKENKLLTGAQSQSRQKAEIIAERFCPVHSHLAGCCCPGAVGRNSPHSSVSLVHWMMLLQLKKGDWAWNLGHFGAPHIAEVMAAHMTNRSSH